MNSQVYHRISLWITILGVAFVAVYSLITYFSFTHEQANWVFSLLYLAICLNFLGGKHNKPETISGRAHKVLKDKRNTIISTILVICFTHILGIVF